MSKFIKPALLILPILLMASCGHDNSVPGGSGFIEATEIIVSAEVTGRLEKLYFDEGQKIELGDTIALIDTTNLTLQLAKARAMLEAAKTRWQAARLQIEKAEVDHRLAQKEFDRISRLIKSGSANQQQYDQAENRLLNSQLAKKTAETALLSAEAEKQSIESDIALLKKQLNDCRPKAPSSGTVVTTYIEDGELIAASKPLIKIARLDSVWVKIYLPPDDLTAIKLGDKAEVDPEDGRKEPLIGHITWISPEAEFTPKNVQTKEARADLVYAVKITVPNSTQTLKIGMPVLVKIK